MWMAIAIAREAPGQVSLRMKDECVIGEQRIVVGPNAIQMSGSMEERDQEACCMRDLEANAERVSRSADAGAVEEGWPGYIRSSSREGSFSLSPHSRLTWRVTAAGALQISTGSLRKGTGQRGSCWRGSPRQEGMGTGAAGKSCSRQIEPLMLACKVDAEWHLVHAICDGTSCRVTGRGPFESVRIRQRAPKGGESRHQSSIQANCVKSLAQSHNHKAQTHTSFCAQPFHFPRIQKKKKETHKITTRKRWTKKRSCSVLGSNQ